MVPEEYVYHWLYSLVVAKTNGVLSLVEDRLVRVVVARDGITSLLAGALLRVRGDGRGNGLGRARRGGIPGQ